MKLLCCLLIALPLILFAQSKSPAKVISVASAATRPLAYFNGSGQVNGFYKDAISEAARRLGLKADYAIYQDGLEKTLRAQRAEVWVAAVANPARRLEFYFSPAWWLDDIHLLVAERSPIQKQEDLVGLRLGYWDSPPMAVPVEVAFPRAKWVTMNSVGPRLEALCRGELDAALMSHSFLSLFWQDRPAPCRDIALRLVKQNRVRQDLSLVSNYANQDLVDRLYRELVGMMRDGTLARLAAEYPMLSPNSAVVLKTEIEQGNRLLLIEVALATALVLLVAGLVYLQRVRWERKQADEARSSAESASLAKDQFLGTLSHEIRTPLHAVSGYLDLLEETLSRPEQRTLAQEVRQSTRALLAMVNETLDYSQLVSGRSETKPIEFRLAALIEDCAASLRQKAETKGLQLLLYIHPQVPASLEGNPRRILQILINLIGNGLKFTESGHVRLDCDFDPQEMVLQLFVQDTGPGIAPEDQALIFEPFQQLDSSDRRKHGGVGLGLAIVNRVVESLGGTLKLESNLGQGARFEVRLPTTGAKSSKGWLEELKHELNLPAGYRVLSLGSTTKQMDSLAICLKALGVQMDLAADAAQLSRLAAESGPGYSLLAEGEARIDTQQLEQKPKWILRVCRSNELSHLSAAATREANAIASWPVTESFLRALLPAAKTIRSKHNGPRKTLVVDDNELNRKLLRALLVKLDCEVEVAADGKEAFEMQLAKGFDIIFMDCQMPVMDGLESTRAIRANSAATPVLIYGVSASTEESTRQRCLSAGMDGYLSKPLGIADLKRILST